MGSRGHPLVGGCRGVNPPDLGGTSPQNLEAGVTCNFWGWRMTRAIVFAVLVAVADPAAAQTDATPLPVELIEVAWTDGYEVAERYAGRVVTRRSSTLGFDRGGLLASVAVDEGATVAEGDLLAELDVRRLLSRRSELRASLDASRARVKEIAARLELAGRTLVRRADLLQRRNVSEELYDQAVFEEKALAAAREAAEAGVAEVEARLAALEVELDLSRLTAPFSGSIVARFADEGAALAAGHAVLELIEDQALEVHVGVPVRAARQLAPGSRHRVRIGETGYDAVLRTLIDRIDPQTRTVTAILELADLPDADASRPRAGELVHLRMTHRVALAGAWLPITALAESRRGLWAAYGVAATERDGVHRITRIELELLHSESERAFVRGTFSDGDRIVANGLHRVVPGQLVRIAAR